MQGGEGDDRLEGSTGRDILIGGAGNDEMNGGSGIDQFRYQRFDGGVDRIEDFTTKGGSKDQLAFVRSLFEDFEGNDAFDLVSDGYLRLQSASGDQTNVQVDVDGGGDSFVTIAILSGSISNNALASQTVLLDDAIT